MNVRILQPGTDLNFPPRNWMRSRVGENGPRAPVEVSGVEPSTSNDDDEVEAARARGPLRFDSGACCISLADFCGRVDFVANAATMKRLFRLMVVPREEVSMAIHRVGGTLLLDGAPHTSSASSSSSSARDADNRSHSYEGRRHQAHHHNPYADSFADKQRNEASERSKALFSKFLYRSALPDDQANDKVVDLPSESPVFGGSHTSTFAPQPAALPLLTAASRVSSISSSVSSASTATAPFSSAERPRAGGTDGSSAGQVVGSRRESIASVPAATSAPGNLSAPGSPSRSAPAAGAQADLPASPARPSSYLAALTTAATSGSAASSPARARASAIETSPRDASSAGLAAPVGPSTSEQKPVSTSTTNLQQLALSPKLAGKPPTIHPDELLGLSSPPSGAMLAVPLPPVRASLSDAARLLSLPGKIAGDEGASVPEPPSALELEYRAIQEEQQRRARGAFGDGGRRDTRQDSSSTASKDAVDLIGNRGVFRHVSMWQLGGAAPSGVSMVLGSDLLTVRYVDRVAATTTAPASSGSGAAAPPSHARKNATQPASAANSVDDDANTTERSRLISLHLRDASRPVTPSEALDLYLDARLAGIEALALCWHKKGVVQGYDVVDTEKVLGLANASAAGKDGTSSPAPQLLNPVAVEEGALSLLRFLRESCSRDGSYWLHRAEGDSTLRLIDLTRPMPRDHYGAHHQHHRGAHPTAASSSSSNNRHPSIPRSPVAAPRALPSAAALEDPVSRAWRTNLAVTCLKYAKRVQLNADALTKRLMLPSQAGSKVLAASSASETVGDTIMAAGPAALQPFTDPASRAEAQGHAMHLRLLHRKLLLECDELLATFPDDDEAGAFGQNRIGDDGAAASSRGGSLLSDDMELASGADWANLVSEGDARPLAAKPSAPFDDSAATSRGITARQLRTALHVQLGETYDDIAQLLLTSPEGPTEAPGQTSNFIRDALGASGAERKQLTATAADIAPAIAAKSTKQQKKQAKGSHRAAHTVSTSASSHQSNALAATGTKPSTDVANVDLASDVRTRALTAWNAAAHHLVFALKLESQSLSSSQSGGTADASNDSVFTSLCMTTNQIVRLLLNSAGDGNEAEQRKLEIAEIELGLRLVDDVASVRLSSFNNTPSSSTSATATRDQTFTAGEPAMTVMALMLGFVLASWSRLLHTAAVHDDGDRGSSSISVLTQFKNLRAVLAELHGRSRKSTERGKGSTPLSRQLGLYTTLQELSDSKLGNIVSSSELLHAAMLCYDVAFECGRAKLGTSTGVSSATSASSAWRSSRLAALVLEAGREYGSILVSVGRMHLSPPSSQPLANQKPTLPNPPAAIACFSRAVDVFTASNDVVNASLARCNVAHVLRSLGATAAATSSNGGSHALTVDETAPAYAWLKLAASSVRAAASAYVVTPPAAPPNAGMVGRGASPSAPASALRDASVLLPSESMAMLTKSITVASEAVGALTAASASPPSVAPGGQESSAVADVSSLSTAMLQALESTAQSCMVLGSLMSQRIAGPTSASAAAAVSRDHATANPVDMVARLFEIAASAYHTAMKLLASQQVRDGTGSSPMSSASGPSVAAQQQQTMTKYSKQHAAALYQAGQHTVRLMEAMQPLSSSSTLDDTSSDSSAIHQLGGAAVEKLHEAASAFEACPDAFDRLLAVHPRLDAARMLQSSSGVPTEVAAGTAADRLRAALSELVACRGPLHSVTRAYAQISKGLEQGNKPTRDKRSAQTTSGAHQLHHDDSIHVAGGAHEGVSSMPDQDQPQRLEISADAAHALSNLPSEVMATAAAILKDLLLTLRKQQPLPQSAVKRCSELYAACLALLPRPQSATAASTASGSSGGPTCVAVEAFLRDLEEKLP